MNLKSTISELMTISTYTSLKQHYVILWFYTVLIFVTSTIGHVLNKKIGFTYGMIGGFIVSTVLWYKFGKKMVS